MATIDIDQPGLSLKDLRSMMTRRGVKNLLVKELAANDVSKSQPYLSGSLDVTNVLPAGDVYVDVTPSKNRILKAPLPLAWLTPDGGASTAPEAKLILYPQYPEVRLSGFLRGADHAPSKLMNKREAGRLLFFGITEQNTVVGWVAGAESRLAAEVGGLNRTEQVGVFRKIPLQNTKQSSRQILLKELRRIHCAGWIESKSLDSSGSISPYRAQNGVGYTLEAELGVPRNGIAEPDFMGWEVKAGQLGSFAWPSLSKAMTLMTPQPTGGWYVNEGPESFVRKYGYADTRGRADRLNFGGCFRANERHQKTRLTLAVRGFDLGTSKVTDDEGAVVLIDDQDKVAAEWSFVTLLSLWNRKHAQAVYVAAEKNDGENVQYRYGGRVRLGEATSFHKLISAIASGRVYYDPAIKLVDASTPTARIGKARSQFRVRFGDLPAMYNNFTEVSVFDDLP